MVNSSERAFYCCKFVNTGLPVLAKSLLQILKFKLHLTPLTNKMGFVKVLLQVCHQWLDLSVGESWQLLGNYYRYICLINSCGSRISLLCPYYLYSDCKLLNLRAVLLQLLSDLRIMSTDDRMIQSAWLLDCILLHILSQERKANDAGEQLQGWWEHAVLPGHGTFKNNCIINYVLLKICLQWPDIIGKIRITNT